MAWVRLALERALSKTSLLHRSIVLRLEAAASDRMVRLSSDNIHQYSLVENEYQTV